MSSSDPTPPDRGGRRPKLTVGGGPLNMAQLLRRRREGKIPASPGGGVLGGSTSARTTSAGLRGEGSGGGGEASGFGFRRNVGQHPSVIARLRHTATLRGHSGEGICCNGRADAKSGVSIRLSLSRTYTAAIRTTCSSCAAATTTSTTTGRDDYDCSNCFGSNNRDCDHDHDRNHEHDNIARTTLQLYSRQKHSLQQQLQEQEKP